MMTNIASGPVTVGTWPNRLVLGDGSMSALGALLEDLGASRALVLCGKTVASGSLLAQTRAALGERYCGVFGRVRAHTPLRMVEEALTIVRATNADAVVTVGGGSAIDAGKGVKLVSMTAGTLDPYLVRYGERGEMRQRRLPKPDIVHIAVPTTSGSASEVMPTAGIRDEQARKKMLFWDDALIPEGVILDPRMTVQTGAFLSAASGMTAVARCIESLFSVNRNPLAEGLALHALRLLHRNLPVVVNEPANLEARYECQVACSMSGIAAINSMVSIVHALGHIVGGKFALQHGVTHAILLAPAMRRMLSTIGERQQFVLQALGGGAAASAGEAGALAADLVDELVAALPLQRRLRDLGLAEAELPDVAEQASHDYMMVNLPRPMDVPEIEALLRAAW
jgi:alcohol dehydrogenase class IV